MNACHSIRDGKARCRSVKDHIHGPDSLVEERGGSAKILEYMPWITRLCTDPCDLDNVAKGGVLHRVHSFIFGFS